MSMGVVDISTAAVRMGITPKAVRNRIARGTLDGVKQDGRWYVALGPCTHHWILETTSGRSTSTGLCRLCGEEREFYNSPEASWAAQAQKAREAKDAAQLP